jgi:mRNA interferase RelE/StbE
MWHLRFTSDATKDFLKLDKSVQRQIKKHFDAICLLEDPKTRGKPLVANWTGHWRYRVGDHRIVCRIEQQEIVIEVVAIGHRSDVY